MGNVASVEKVLPLGLLSHVKNGTLQKRKRGRRKRGKVTIFKRGDYYHAYFTSGKYKQERISLCTKDKNEALIQANKIERRLLEGEYRRPSDISMCDFIDEYYDHVKPPRTTKGTFDDIRRYIKKFVGITKVRRLKQVDTVLFTKFLNRYTGNGYKPKTYNNVRIIMHAMMNFAVNQGYLSSNPVSKIKPLKVPDCDIRFIKTREEIDRFLNAFKGDMMYPLIATYIYAGLRRTEAIWLTWNDIDFEKKLLYVRAKTVNGKQWTTKTKKNRTVPISNKLHAILKQHKLDTGGQQDGLVFPSPKGFHWDEDNCSERYRRIVRKAGFHWTIQDLRHTFGSHLAMKGISLYKISTFMGNSEAVCKKHYAALLPEQLHEDVEI